MKWSKWISRWSIGPCVIGLLALPVGCQPDPGEEPEDDPRREVPEELREGLTPEELRERAEPIPQEEAQRRGMIDTTIYIEDLDVDEAGDPTGPEDPPG